MKRRLFRIYAMAVLGLSTALCGLAALVLATIDPSGEGAFRVARLWARILLRAGGLRVAVSGRENIPRDGNWIYIANHQSILDIPALLSIFPESVRMVAKIQLFGIPLFGAVIRRMGFVPVDRDDRHQAIASLDDAAELIRAGSRMLVFAEGERSADGRLLPFKKGPFVLALRTQLPIVPIAISGAAELLPRNTFEVRPGTIRIRIGEPIRTEGLGYDDRDALSARTRAFIAANVDESPPRPAAPPDSAPGGARAPAEQATSPAH